MLGAADKRYKGLKALAKKRNAVINLIQGLMEEKDREEVFMFLEVVKNGLMKDPSFL